MIVSADVCGEGVCKETKECLRKRLMRPLRCIFLMPGFKTWKTATTVGLGILLVQGFFGP